MTTPRQELAKYATQAQMSNFFIDKMGIISLKAYGCIGNGVNNDTIDAQSAVDAAIANGNNMVFCPNGTYYNTGLTNTSQVTFIGDGASFTGSTYTIHQLGDLLTDQSTTITDLLADIIALSSSLRETTTSLRTDLNSHSTNTQLHLSILSTKGDMVYRGTSSNAVLAMTTTPGQYIKASTNGLPVWANGLDSAVQAVGDLVYGTGVGATTRLAATTEENMRVLGVSSGIPAYIYPPVVYYQPSDTVLLSSSSEHNTNSTTYVVTGLPSFRLSKGGFFRAKGELRITDSADGSIVGFFYNDHKIAQLYSATTAYSTQVDDSTTVIPPGGIVNLKIQVTGNNPATAYVKNISICASVGAGSSDAWL